MKSLKNKRKNKVKDAVIFLETSPCARGNLGCCQNSGNSCTGSCNHSSK